MFQLRDRLTNLLLAAVDVVVNLFRIVKPQVQVYNLDDIPLINARVYPTERMDYLFLKRAFD